MDCSLLSWSVCDALCGHWFPCCLLNWCDLGEGVVCDCLQLCHHTPVFTLTIARCVPGRARRDRYLMSLTWVGGVERVSDGVVSGRSSGGVTGEVGDSVVPATGSSQVQVCFTRYVTGLLTSKCAWSRA